MTTSNSKFPQLKEAPTEPFQERGDVVHARRIARKGRNWRSPSPRAAGLAQARRGCRAGAKKTKRDAAIVARQ